MLEPCACAPMPRPLLLLLLAAGVLLAAPGQAQTCSQLRSCEEAMRSLRDGNWGLDRDGDGIPCQNTLCKDYRRPTGGSGSSAGPRPVMVIQTGPAAAPQPRSRQPAALPAAGLVELVSVGDGDSIRVRGRDGQPVTVRLACIDAPETAQGPAGAEATATLRQLLEARPLELRPQTVDRYGRTVAEVIAGGRNVNLEMVRTGAAFVYHQYLRDCDGNAYITAEQQAQRFRQGVWRWDQGLERPWDFRRRIRNR
jgi:endonuclease YncB( thermonuclease family)